MRQTPALYRIEQIIRPTVESMGYELVSVRMLAPNGRRSLQIMAEPTGGEREMTVNDCAMVSRAVSALLDVEDPIDGAYNLEVSSPGIDRPLARARDFERHIGHEAQVEMELAVNGRRRFRGTIAAVEGEDVLLTLPDADVPARLAMDAMLSAKLVLTDALIKDYQRKRQQSGTDA